MNRACFPEEKTPEFTKMGEIHELFVLALSLVWFAGANRKIPNPKNLCDKDFAEVSSELSGASRPYFIGLCRRVYQELVLFVRFFGFGVPFLPLTFCSHRTPT